jgi:hypothetical protein
MLGKCSLSYIPSPQMITIIVIILSANMYSWNYIIPRSRKLQVKVFVLNIHKILPNHELIPKRRHDLEKPFFTL